MRPDSAQPANTEPQAWLHIARWHEFQHYKHRRPLWIKSYVRLLDNPNYRALTFKQRGILDGLFLLYAASSKGIPASPSYIARALGGETEYEARLATISPASRHDLATISPASRRGSGENSVRSRDLKALEQAGFIYRSASSALANASLETETETETEKEQNPLATAPPTPPTKPPARARKPRAPDVIWDTLVDLIGATPGGMERGRWNKAIKSLRDSGATPETLRSAAAAYRSLPTFADCVMTPTALASNWTTLTANGNGSHIVTESAEQFRARIAASEGRWKA